MAGLADVGRLAWSDVRVLEEIYYLCKLRKRKGLQPYCIPGRRYLSRKTGYAIRTITRATDRLEAAGLIQKRQRRPVQGKWATNLYRPVQKRFWKLAGRSAKPFHHLMRSVTERLCTVGHLRLIKHTYVRK